MLKIPQLAAVFTLDFSNSNVSDVAAQLAANENASTADWARTISDFLTSWADPSVTSIKVFSSGTTGPPRAIEHTKSAMLASAEATVKFLHLHRGDSALLCLPADKISGMMMMVRSIHAGLRLMCIRPSVHPLLELSSNEVIEFAAFTPLQLHDIKQSDAAFAQASLISRIILGGETVNEELNRAVQKLPGEVYATFGMTETISHIALKRLNGKHPDRHFRTLPGIAISSTEDDRLIIHAPNLGAHHLLTNDVVEVLSETEFEWKGRADHVINRGGVKIYPEEIEYKLHPLLSCRFFIAERIIPEFPFSKLLLIVEQEQIPPVVRLRLERAFASLEKLERPDEIRCIPSFVLTENGKINRRETLERLT